LVDYQSAARPVSLPVDKKTGPGAAGRAADLLHIFEMEVDEVTERTNLEGCSWLW
jgi:hypothetical protein